MGRFDILWYDVDKPLTTAQWEADRMNRMVFELQPEIIVNNRNGLDGDFGTPEHTIKAEARAWESCDTLNLGWGYQRTDDEWKTPRRIVDDLTICAQQGGNYLLNIGPEMDGTVPAGDRADSNDGWGLAGYEWRCHLWNRGRGVGEFWELHKFYPQGAYFIYSRLFLAE